jgi:phosphoribosylaminoimidazole-succinocarboxamide synthase
MISDNDIRRLMAGVVTETPTIAGARRFSGKVRECYVFDNGVRAIVVTDRISVFDHVAGAVPLKGRVLNAMTTYWLQRLQEAGIRTHLISTPHPNISLNVDLKVIPVEFVVRGYLTGTTTTSSWHAYTHNDRTICGLVMPAGMRKNEPFPTPLFTPTTKGNSGHDVNISKEDIVRQGLLSESLLAEAEELALRVFALGQAVASERGLILVDTKYEFGVDPGNNLIVVDEVHTPDSSRYWVQKTYNGRMSSGREPESLDKEFVRRMIVEAGYDIASDRRPSEFLDEDMILHAARKYFELYEVVTGEPKEALMADADASMEEVLLAASGAPSVAGLR